jgi:hypothetical protein
MLVIIARRTAVCTDAEQFYHSWLLANAIDYHTPCRQACQAGMGVIATVTVLKENVCPPPECPRSDSEEGARLTGVGATAELSYLIP